MQMKLIACAFLVAFVPVLALGWICNRGRLRPLALILWSAGISAALVALSAFLLAGLFLFMMGDKVTAHVDPPLTVEQARRAECPIPLPDSAQNVQFVFAAGGIQALEILVRFEAPLPDCRDEARRDFEHEENLMGFHPPSPQQLKPILRAPRPEDHDMVGRAAWFDIENIRQGVSAYDGGNTQIWIEESRGGFYCKITD
jgi:hypothetical protein